MDELNNKAVAEEENVQATTQKKSKNRLNKILAYTLIPLALFVAFTAGYFSRYIFHADTANTASDILSLIEKVGYVYDPETGEERALTEDEVANLLVYGLLDDYSAYFTKEEYQTVNLNAEGRFLGIGISITLSGEVSSVTLNSPAELAGIIKGDIMVALSIEGGEKILYSQNESRDFRNALVNATNGQTVNLTLMRDSQEFTVNVSKKAFVASYVKYFDSEKTLDFRDEDDLELEPVASDGGMKELDTKTAYIKLVSFNGDADEQIKDALEYMRLRGRDKLILDLRDNGGGYTDVLEDIASNFIYNDGSRKSLISYAEGKSKSQSFYTDDNNFNTDIKAISVLANENTASASECLIGAMLHYGDRFDNGKLIIEKNAEGVARTYGKGIMQTTYRLIGGGALKLTTARIYLPDKTTSIHGVGFRPLEQNAVEKGQALARAIEVLA